MNFSEDDIANAQKDCWDQGDLTWLLDDNQLEIYASINDSKSKFYTVECARRLGKSFLLCVMAVEKCLKHPGARVLYAAPTTKDAQEIVAPLIEEICKTAPFTVKYNPQQSKFIFPNKSQIRLFGCDNKTKANRGRGSGAHLVLIDEAGFVPTLDYVLHSIVAPQTLTTRGRVILASTPSDEPQHPFTLIAEKAEQTGSYVRKTIYDNPRLTEEDINQYIADDASIMGMTVEEFKNSDVYKREHLALRVIDTNLVVVPEWHGAFQDQVRPEFYDAYVSLDLGGVDPHGILFGYWDYASQTLVIEDELLLRDGEDTQVICERVKAKEKFLWGVDSWDGTLRAAQEQAGIVHGLDSKKQPYLRVCDMGGPKIDLKIDGVHFLATEKAGKWEVIAQVRAMIREGKIKISSKCRNLDRHLRTTMWQNERVQSYRRKNGEHGDLVDALLYMVRNIRKTRDPRPFRFGIDHENTYIRPPDRPKVSLLSWSDETRLSK